ncbi:MAG: hypothetical protein C4291_02145 [Candidatus Dadabacteria bacterium]
MGQFEWIIAIAVLVVFIVNIIFLVLTYRMLKPLVAKLQATNDRIAPILSEIHGIIGDNRDKINAVVSESQPLVRDILTKTNYVVTTLHDILSEARGILSENRPKVSAFISDAQPVVHDIGKKASDITITVHDIVLTVKDEVKWLDSIVRSLDDKINEAASILQSRIIEPVVAITEPVREINYIGVAVKRAISTLINSKTVS